MKHDYQKEVLKVIGVTIVLLLLFGLIPTIKLQYKQFSLFSDIQKDSVSKAPSLAENELDIADEIEAIKDSISKPEENKITHSVQTDIIQPISDYSENGSSLASLFKALGNNQRPIRIGVLGDSFVESDIFTLDLRALLQKQFGGNGLGFLPIASPAAKYRKNVQHSFSGWDTKSMIHFKNTDWKRFCLSGLYFIPKEDAFVSLTLPKDNYVTQATFVFTNRKQTKINVSINKEASTQQTPIASDTVQFITLENDKLQSISISVNNVEGFTAFGVFLNNPTGVYVDNYSVRGSSGSVLTTINPDFSNELSKHYPYDLLILQHGLNVIANDTSRYPIYKKLMVSAVKHIQKCYPGVPLLMMSVGDKGHKTAQGVTTHPGVEPLVMTQQKVAQETGIAFWNTFMAMGGENSMVKFVQNTPPMAAKDYTHINYLGGKKIAEEFFKSLMAERDRYILSIQ